MASALLDAERVVAAHGHPGDAGGAQIVKDDVLAVGITREELRAPEARNEDVLAQLDRPVLVVGHPEAARTRRLSLQRAEEREEVGFDRQPPRVAGLGRLDEVRRAVDGLIDVNDAMLEVDVVPGERLQLAGTREEVHRGDVEATEREVDPSARDEAEKFGWVEVLLRPRAAAVRAPHFERGSVVAHA